MTTMHDSTPDPATVLRRLEQIRNAEGLVWIDLNGYEMVQICQMFDPGDGLKTVLGEGETVADAVMAVPLAGEG